MALTYGELSSITQKYFVPKLVDNIFASNAALSRARKKWYEKGSGISLMQPLAYATTSAAQRFSGSDSLNITANDQITAATWVWKEMQAPITITKIDELTNSGPQQVVNFVKAKVQMAEKSLGSMLGTDLFGDGTTANSIEGLAMVTAVTGSHGGIAKQTYSWWQAKQDTTAAAITYARLRGLMGDCTIDNDKPTVAFTTQDIYDDITLLFQPQQRFTDAKTADAGFSNILVEGMPVIVDSHVASGDCYLINENYVTLYYLEDFRFDPFVKPTNQAVSTAHIYWTGALASSNNRMHGVFTALV